ncbi:hypothetical protein [Paralimibaculum aggregatum]|nr:hypothetical protein [Limibaculum sp. NKW23]
MSDSPMGLRMFRAMASALTSVGAVTGAARAVADYGRLERLPDLDLAAGGFERARLGETLLCRHLRNPPAGEPSRRR